jgi:hypothetical protein
LPTLSEGNNAVLPSLGSIVLRTRQKYGRGLRVAYFRDRVRPRILNTRPIECGKDATCEIHTLTSAGDWLNLVWALKSFYHYSGRRYGLCIHDDGSLEPSAIDTLAAHFPGARIVRRTQADREVPPGLAGYPRCLEFRRTNLLAPKLFDFAHYLSADRMLLVDSDILFFSRPDELLRRIDDPAYILNSVNADCASEYTVESDEAARRWGIALTPRFNSGLGVIHRGSLRLDWIEEFLESPVAAGHFWRIEQTLFALTSSRFGVELLPEEYAVRLDGEVGSAPCRHYVGDIRHLMYGEGMRRLVKSGFLDAV